MNSKFSSYQNIDPFYYTLFERLWARYASILPALPNDIQTSKNTKAAVFNVWVSIYAVSKHLLIRTDKKFLHTYQEQFTTRFKANIPETLKPIVNSYQVKHHHAFLYSYLITYRILQELSVFVAQHEKLEASILKKYSYYSLTDYDLNPTDDAFYIIKILNTEFIQAHLTPKLYEDIHYYACNHVQALLEEAIL